MVKFIAAILLTLTLSSTALAALHFEAPSSEARFSKIQVDSVLTNLGLLGSTLTIKGKFNGMAFVKDKIPYRVRGTSNPQITELVVVLEAEKEGEGGCDYEKSYSLQLILTLTGRDQELEVDRIVEYYRETYDNCHSAGFVKEIQYLKQD